MNHTLALHGGNKIRNTPMPTRRLFDEKDKEAVISLFDRAIEEGSHILGYNGDQEQAYCKAFVDFMGGGYADGVNSGTNALYVAIRALELEPYSQIIVPPISDPGGVMPVVLSQMIPVPADCEPDSYNICPKSLEACITSQTRAIIVAHITGRPAEMDAIMDIAQRHHLKVIEDCAQAHGALYHGQPVGSIGDIGTFSTMFGKHHATGGQGGVVYTSDEGLYRRIRSHADRGKSFGLNNTRANLFADLNCNMDEIHACIGRSQIQKLPKHLKHLRHLAKRVSNGTQRLKAIRMVDDPQNTQGAHWFLMFHINFDRLKVDKAQLIQTLDAEGLVFLSSYLHSPAVWPWFENRCAYGSSDVPWNQSDALTPNTFDTPNIDVVDSAHILFKIDEGFENQDVDDIIAGLEKIENAYLKS